MILCSKSKFLRVWIWEQKLKLKTWIICTKRYPEHGFGFQCSVSGLNYT